FDIVQLRPQPTHLCSHFFELFIHVVELFIYFLESGIHFIEPGIHFIEPGIHLSQDPSGNSEEPTEDRYHKTRGSNDDFYGHNRHVDTSIMPTIETRFQ